MAAAHHHKAARPKRPARPKVPKASAGYTRIKKAKLGSASRSAVSKTKVISDTKVSGT